MDATLPSQEWADYVYKGPDSKYLGFVDHTISVTTIQLFSYFIDAC